MVLILTLTVTESVTKEYTSSLGERQRHFMFRRSQAALSRESVIPRPFYSFSIVFAEIVIATTRNSVHESLYMLGKFFFSMKPWSKFDEIW